MKIRNMCLVGVMAATLCLMGPMTVPVGPVPLSMIGFGIYLCSAVLGPRRGALAVLVYILLGMAGFPVFSGFTAGAARILGPTGGFIIGYLPCAMIAGLGGDRRHMYPAMAAGTLLMYALGTVWFMAQSNTALVSALASCVLPFVPGDILKIVAACAVARAVNRALNISQNQ